MAVRIMSDKELARLEVLRDLDGQRLTAQAAAGVLGLSQRQVLRLLKAYRTSGVDGLISKQRGRPSTVTSDGRRLLVYSWLQARARPQSFIPIVGPFVAGADTRSSSVMIWIDPNGVLENYSASQSQYGMGQGVTAGSDPEPVPNQPRISPREH